MQWMRHARVHSVERGPAQVWQANSVDLASGSLALFNRAAQMVRLGIDALGGRNGHTSCLPPFTMSGWRLRWCMLPGA